MLAEIDIVNCICLHEKTFTFKLDYAESVDNYLLFGSTSISFIDFVPIITFHQPQIRVSGHSSARPPRALLYPDMTGFGLMKG